MLDAIIEFINLFNKYAENLYESINILIPILIERIGYNNPQLKQKIIEIFMIIIQENMLENKVIWDYIIDGLKNTKSPKTQIELFSLLSKASSIND